MLQTNKCDVKTTLPLALYLSFYLSLSFFLYLSLFFFLSLKKNADAATVVLRTNGRSTRDHVLTPPDPLSLSAKNLENLHAIKREKEKEKKGREKREREIRQYIAPVHWQWSCGTILVS
jgi:hypothetical protein